MKPKFLLGGSLIVSAAILLVVTSMASTMQYFLTVTQLRDRGAAVIGQGARVAGAVIFESTLYELRNGEPHLEFDIVDTEDQIGQQTPLRIVYHGPKPDLLKPHAQAIVEGQLTADGKFVADNLLLKCPTRYEDQFPDQAAAE